MADELQLKILNELRNNTWVMLKPSPIEGIGVFAIQTIPKGCRAMFSAPDPQEQWIKVPKSEIEKLPEHAKHLVYTYCLYDETDYYLPENGFKKMDLVSFLNHSDEPNLISIDEGNYFEATRAIAAGEELLIDYGTIVDE